MLFNCLNCCKAISSRTTQCPYCMVEIIAVVEKLDISKKSEPLPVRSVQSELKARKTLVYSAMASISQIVQVLRSPKTRSL